MDRESTFYTEGVACTKALGRKGGLVYLWSRSVSSSCLGPDPDVAEGALPFPGDPVFLGPVHTLPGHHPLNSFVFEESLHPETPNSD